MDDMSVDEGGGGGGFSGGDGGYGGVSSVEIGSFTSMMDGQPTVTLGPLPSSLGDLSSGDPGLSPSGQLLSTPGSSLGSDGDPSSPGITGSTPTITTTITYGGGGSSQGEDDAGSGGTSSSSSAGGGASSAGAGPDAGSSPSSSGAPSSWVPTVTFDPPGISLPPGDPGDDGPPASDPGSDPGTEPGGDGSGGGGGLGGGGSGGGIVGSAGASPAGEPVSRQAITAAITQYYQQILGRAPDTGGLANYTNAVLSGSMTLQQVRQSIADSQEARTDLDGIISAVQGRQATAGDDPWIQAQQASLANGSTTLAGIRQSLASFSGEAGVVTSMYQALVGRAPSAAEISATEAQLAAGVSLQTIRTADASSPEAVARLNQIYQNELGRQSDAGGLANYEGFLANGGSLAQVAQSVGQSQEAQGDLDRIITDVQGRQATAADQPWIQAQEAALASGSTTLAAVRQNLASFSGEAGVVTSMYQDLVGRAPSAAEISATEAQLAAGVSLQTIRTADASSPEAESRIESIYQGVLGRQADAPGLASWEGDLANGATLAQVQQQIAQSPEAQDDLDAIISDVQGRQATAADQPWIQAQQAALGNGSTTLAAIGNDLAVWTATASAPTGPVGSFPSMQALTSALLTEYQKAVDEGYEAATLAVSDDEANGVVYSPLSRQAKIGQLMDASARGDIKDWLVAHDVSEGKTGVVQVNRRLYAEDGSGFRIPDVRVNGQNIIFDASLTAKNWKTSQVKDFVGSAGTTVVIVRPTALGGAYSVVVPKG